MTGAPSAGGGSSGVDGAAAPRTSEVAPETEAVPDAGVDPLDAIDPEPTYLVDEPGDEPLPVPPPTAVVPLAGIGTGRKRHGAAHVSADENPVSVGSVDDATGPGNRERPVAESARGSGNRPGTEDTGDTGGATGPGGSGTPSDAADPATADVPGTDGGPPGADASGTGTVAGPDAGSVAHPVRHRLRPRPGTMPGVPAPEVIAVVTLRAGQPHRDRVLDAVAAQTRSPDTIVLVDLTEAPRPRRRRAPAPAIEPSGDGGLALLDAVGDEHTESHVLRLPPRTGAGDAVRAALIALPSTGLTPEAPPEGLPAPDPAAGPGPAEGPGTPADEAPGPAGTSWLWLVPDDAVPAPDTLRRLLEAVETAPSVGVAGCKQVWWEDDQRLIDVGFTTSRRGVRVTGIERYEVDQGQHDHRCDVLAVSGAGMLVRRDVWDVTGGPDPGLARARDDLDLCRRARLAGHRVVVVPRAVVSRAGRVTAAGGAPVPASRTTTRGPWARADRYDTLFLRLAGVPLPFLPLILLDILPGTLLRSLGLLLTRRPGRAVQEIIAAILVLARPHRWIPARRRAARRTLPRRMLRPLLATRRDLWRQRREALTFGSRGLPAPASSRRAVPFPGAPVRTPAPPPGPAPAPGPGNDLDTGPGTVPTAATGTGIDLLIDLTGEIPVAGDRVGRRSRRDGIPAPGAGPDDEPLQIRAAGPRLTSQSRRSVVLAPLPVLLLTAVAGLLALRRLLPGTGSVAGPYLLPAPGSAAELWRAVSSPLRPLGLGARAVADPFAELVAAIGAVPGLSPRL
ncbi:MAG: glycosyltransferase, partial [Kineosporiaceae bacterium]